MSVCGVEYYVNLSEGRPKFKFFDFQKMLKIYLRDKRKLPG
jgi:hypothetical protein